MSEPENFPSIGTATGDAMAAVEANRALVLSFCQHMSDRNYDAMLQLVDPNGEWWVVGDPARFAGAGANRIREIILLQESALSNLDAFAYTVTGVIAQGARVAVEATSMGKAQDREYRNDYVKIFDVRDRRIVRVREFLDHSAVEKFMAGAVTAGTLGSSHSEPGRLVGQEKMGR